MFLKAIIFLLGLCVPIAFTHLLSVPYLILTFVSISLLLYLYKRAGSPITSPLGSVEDDVRFFKFKQLLQYPAIFLIGILWMNLYSYHTLRWSLSPDLEGKPIIVIGTIQSIPENFSLSERFGFDVNTMSINGQSQKIHTRLELSWYKPYPKNLSIGDRWQLTVKLKRPHALSDPGVMNVDQIAFLEGIRAKGYVVSQAKNQALGVSHYYFIGKIREYFDTQVQSHLGDSPIAGIIRAVTVGDKSGISQEQWGVFQRTGTNHLIAISGLHIGLVSGLFFVFINFVWRCFPLLCLFMPSIRAAALAAILAALVYSGLAGFAVPTQRALVMLIFFMGSLFLKRHLRPWHAWSWSMIVVLILNPLNVLSPGFWMSFIAVGGLILGLSGRLHESGLWWRWGRAQWVMTLAIMPVTLIIFQQASLIAPIANALAIPWVGCIVVPLSLIACFFSFSCKISSVLFYLASKAMLGFWFVLQWLADLPDVSWFHAMPNIFILMAVGVGVIIVLLPAGFPARIIGFLWVLPLVFYQGSVPKANDFNLTVLDVGQGLSSVIQTQHHVLVFDTGADYGDGYDMGSVVLVPYLRSMGIKQVNTLVVSHGDNDHIGGAASLLKVFPANDIDTSVPERFSKMKLEKSILKTCLEGQSWDWDGVHFQFLYPTPTLLGMDNNSSCVLKISNGVQAVLLTGDIEKPAEDYLVANEMSALKSSILVAPHHGSKTSSTLPFVQAVDPRAVIFPIGYLNKFKFPSSSVFALYQSLHVETFDTAAEGAITFNLTQSALFPSPLLYRRHHLKFWMVSS